MPGKRERIARGEGARGVQNLYMTGTMQNPGKPTTAILQAFD